MKSENETLEVSATGIKSEFHVNLTQHGNLVSLRFLFSVMYEVRGLTPYVATTSVWWSVRQGQRLNGVPDFHEIR